MQPVRNQTQIRARLEALLEQWGTELGAALNVVCVQGLRLTYVAGPTRKLPCVPAQRVPIAEKVAIMVYGETPIDGRDEQRLTVKATKSGVAPAALSLVEAETEALESD